MVQSSRLQVRQTILPPAVMGEDELESLDDAIAEVRRQIAGNALDKNYLWGRLTELESGRKDLRRRRAKTLLDSYLPPVTFYSIEAERKSLSQLFRAAWRLICLSVRPSSAATSHKAQSLTLPRRLRAVSWRESSDAGIER